MTKKTLNDYFSGYIIVKAQSLNPEGFINMCARNGIQLRDINKKNYTTIEFKMKHNQYKLLKKIIHKTNSKTRILKKYGVHFTYKNINRRKFFILGSACFIVLLFFLSSIIWNIDIKGTKKINETVIIDTLKKSGLKVGVFKYNLNLRKIEENSLKDINEISVIKISFKGTKAEVEVVERTMPSEIINIDTPANIVATKAGIITKILSYKGQSVVKKGDYVKPNQILISGKLTNPEITDESNRPVHAMGIVNAKTWYESIKDIKFNYIYETRSGRFKQKIYYIVGGKKLYIKNSNINFKKYDRIEVSSDLKTWGHLLPLKIRKITETYYEKIDESKLLSYNDAVNIGVKLAEEQLKKTMPENGKVIDKKVFKQSDNKKVRIRVLYILDENIGIESKIK